MSVQAGRSDLYDKTPGPPRGVNSLSKRGGTSGDKASKVTQTIQQGESRRQSELNDPLTYSSQHEFIKTDPSKQGREERTPRVCRRLLISCDRRWSCLYL